MAIAIKALESWLNKRTERFGRCRDHGFSRDKARGCQLTCIAVLRIRRYGV
jgi:hypothetical protein